MDTINVGLLGQYHNMKVTICDIDKKQRNITNILVRKNSTNKEIFPSNKSMKCSKFYLIDGISQTLNHR